MSHPEQKASDMAFAHRSAATRMASDMQPAYVHVSTWEEHAGPANSDAIDNAELQALFGPPRQHVTEADSNDDEIEDEDADLQTLLGSRQTQHGIMDTRHDKLVWVRQDTTGMVAAHLQLPCVLQTATETILQF